MPTKLICPQCGSLVSFEHHCEQCDHRWVPRKSDVVECPRCKRRDWDKPKKETVTK